jgi:protein-L-isoaspartate O-methyltransferase
VNWQEHATRLAAEVTEPSSRWRPVVAVIPRHVLVPAWWDGAGAGWARADAQSAGVECYRDRTLVTQVGACHADHAGLATRAEGPPTSSSTQPSLVITMYRAAVLGEGMHVLDVGTGSGYGAALLATRLGGELVTSIDVDPYLTLAAMERLDAIGLHPAVVTGDATSLPLGSYDRVVSMMSVSPVPPGWLAALRPGGRLVTTIAGTGLLVTANKTPDGGAAGRVEWHRAAFMRSRTGPGYLPGLLAACPRARDGDGDEVTTSPYPLPPSWSWDLTSMLAVMQPGVERYDDEQPGGQRTTWLLHPDGSWARATATGDEPPVVHQAGPRRLWDTLDSLRRHWLRHGSLPVYGSEVTIAPDGAITFARGRWTATIPATT